MQGKNLFLIRGVSGSGKSTLAALLADALPDAYHFETDDYFKTVDGACNIVYRFDPAKLPEAHRWCQRLVEEEMAMGSPDILVSNTFTQRWELQPYVDLAKRHGYTVTEITLQPHLTNAELAARNVHGLNERKIAQQRRRWEDRFEY